MIKKYSSVWIISCLIILISILHYFGGPANDPIHNYFRLLYFLPIIFAAVKYGFKGGVITSIIISLIYSPFILLSVGELKKQALNDTMDIVLFFTIGIVAGTLVEKKNMNAIRLESELKRHMLLESYTSGIIESIKGGVITLNSDLLITVINQGARDLFQIDQNCIGLSIPEAFRNKEVGVCILTAIENNITNKKVDVSIEDGAGNNPLNLQINIYPMSFEESVKGFVIIIDDSTELKRLQTQLARNEKLAALGELSSGIAHEIRNPLGIIKAIEQTMKKELSDNPEAVKELEVIDEEIERANKVVKGLMEFGKPSKQEMLVQSLNSLIDEVLTIVNKYIVQHGVQIEFIKNGYSNVFMDKDLMKQAFINIIFNAVQAMPDGGKLDILTARQDENYVKAVFADTGTGIEEENIERIFNPFFTTKEEGTGLGLSLVQRIVEEHGGMLNVASRVDEGTRFEILLPIWKEN